ncbi:MULTISPECIES: hypothetical protein [unclassified Psychrobacter]|uniref:hypothetical protein n=1 Tax=unclassified Psychrobacter TaxID=196806 RepID=UPI0025E25156|nr:MULTISPECIES: hypothetical protein [unclassified Psychrobacter]
MANSERIIKDYIKSEQRKGTATPKIIVGITELKGQAGKDAKEFIKQTRAAGLSPTQELGKYFGLSTKPVDPKATSKNKNATLADKAKSTNYSAMTGVAKSFGKVAQLNNSFVDKLYGGINNVAGTNLPTNNRANYDKDVQAMEARQAQLRDQANYSGVDLGELGGSIAAKAPLYVAGGAPTAGVKGLAAFAGREAAIGGLDGSLMHSKSTSEQVGNTALGAIGGAVGGVAGVTVGKTVGSVIKKGSRVAANRSGRTATAATKLVDDAITETGIRVNQATRNRLVNDATKNLSKSKQIDAAAAVRKSLLDSEGFKGTQAQLSKRPEEWRAERELAKNNSDLNNTHIGNNEQLTSKWESLVDETGARPVDNNARMESTFQTLKQGDEARQADIGAKYNAAREMGGNDAQLNHMRFIDQTSRELEEQGLGSFLKGDIRGVFKGMFENPDFKLTHGKSEEIVKILNARLKTTTDGNERAALAIVRKNLDNEVDRSIDELGGALPNGDINGGLAGARGAWQEARGAARDRFQDLDSNPALKAAIDDMAPDKAFDKLVLKANERDLVKLVDSLKNSPDGKQNLADLQGATIEHFITKATGADNGAFSTAQLNKAIQSFGNNRMRALFTPEQIARINDIQKVGDILMQRPQGAHINDSNTASTLINQLIGIANMTGKIPVLGNVGIGAAKAVGDLAQSGAGAKMINGQPAITRGSSLGLTDEQLRLLGMMPAAGQAGAAVGANLGN